MTPDRIARFRRDLQRAAAERVLTTPNGTAILAPSIRDVYDANYLSVETASADAAALADEADVVLEVSHHRRVIVEDGAPGLADDFAALGFERASHLVLEHRRAPDRIVDDTEIREVDLDALIPARTRATLAEPWGDHELASQLNEAKRHVARAVPVRYFAAVAGGGVAGWCELRVAGGVAQIEDVEVLGEFRGRGYGRAVVQRALAEGRRTAEVVFLEALADDWPRELYAKLGFDVVGRRDFYTRLPHPLTRLRLRTPRLELRVPTVAELRALDPGAPAPGQRELVAFLDGMPVGVQSLDADAEDGTWLSARFRDQGLGAEMREAALTLEVRTP